LKEPNLGKTNPRVSLHYSLAICFAPSLVDSIIFLTLTRLVVVIIFENFSFALFTPCRCFGSDRTPGVAPQGVFRSRTVSTTVAKWFVPIARGTVDKVYRFGPLRDA
jgi:hypothetical protein